MTKTELETYRQRLLALQQRLNGDVSLLADEALHKAGEEGSGNLSKMPIHMADLGTDNYEQEFTLNLLENEEKSLDEIVAALDRIHQGDLLVAKNVMRRFRRHGSRPCRSPAIA